VDLIPLDKLASAAPTWPWSTWATRHLIRTGQLGCVRVGRRVFLTRDLLNAFVTQHIVNGGKAA
jgi:hypothetical protein